MDLQCVLLIGHWDPFGLLLVWGRGLCLCGTDAGCLCSPTLYLSRRQADRDEVGAQRRLRKVRAECGTLALCTVYTNMVCDTLTPVQPGAPTHAVSPCVLQHLHEYSRCFSFCRACHIAPRAHGGSCLFCASFRLFPRHRTLMDETHDELHYECLSDFLLADTDTFTTGSSLDMEENPLPQSED